MKRKLKVFIAGILLLLCACRQNDAPLTWQDQYDLGIHYLSESNYEQAIIAFTAAIEIEPMRPEAYVGRGQAYINSGETKDNMAAALADYEDGINLNRENVAAWLGLG